MEQNIYIYIYLFDISITYLFQLELLKYINIIEFQESLTTYIVLINDGNEFPISFKNIYPKELELKVKHHGIKASFLGLEIKIEDTDYKRDKFTFFIVQMPHLSSKSAISYFQFHFFRTSSHNKMHGKMQDT